MTKRERKLIRALKENSQLIRNEELLTLSMKITIRFCTDDVPVCASCSTGVQRVHLGFSLQRPLSSDGVSIVPVAAWVAVRVEPVLHVGLLCPLIQSLHVEQVLLGVG